jgi:hypothetical protein
MERRGRSLWGRVAELGALAAALIACYYAGKLSNRASSVDPNSIPLVRLQVESVNAPRSVDEPRVPEPRAVAARANSIQRDADSIAAECAAHGGDWQRWQRDTGIYRNALRKSVESLKDFEDAASRSGLTKYAALAGRDGFPLFEIGAREQLIHLYDPSSLDQFRQEKSVVAASRWLHERGVDLIFVPIPKMAEIYIEHFLDPSPQDGIIAPDVRKTLLELLEQDVEVVDCFPLFRALRDQAPDYLYNSADTHWGPRAMRIAAKQIADRIARYRFGATARYGLPIVKSVPASYSMNPGFRTVDDAVVLQNGWNALTPAQKSTAALVQSDTTNLVTLLDGRKPPHDLQSPVLLIGHSYVPSFREQLVRELNLLINTSTSNDQTTEAFASFLRQPELLEHCRVLVWITTDLHMTRFRPMPKPILAVLEADKKASN